MSTGGPSSSLDDEIERDLARKHPVVAVARIAPGGTSTAARGTTTAADLEIGSVSKGITGLLYADALDRGLVEPTTPLGALLPLDASAPAAAVTLGALSTHRSGLPSLPGAAQPLRRSIRLWVKGTNPYGESLDELLAQVESVPLGKPSPRYSNLGFQLLGHALASAAGTTYAELLRTRVSQPLGLTSLYFPATPAELRATSVAGRSARGHTREPWTGEGLAPAGGIRASIDDMATLAGALLDGTAPGLAALDPVSPFSGRVVQIGAAWLQIERDGRLVTWHNGMTGGFSSWFGLDRAAGTGVVILSATSRSVDQVGFRLLSRLTAGTLS